MVRWVVRSILHDGPIELFLYLASGIYYPVCGMVHIKEPLLPVAHIVAAAGFLIRYLSGPWPYVPRHITVNKMC